MAGILVGGASRRMGRAKGLLPAPGGEPLVLRAARLTSELGLETVLVGERSEYASVPLPRLPDDPAGVGPLGGLSALLAFARERRALALACDMPFVTRADLEALLAAPAAAVVAPRRGTRWEPLCAVYEPARVLPVVRRRLEAGQRSLQGLLDALDARVVELEDAHLDDWDTPRDVAGHPRSAS
jgi:molybdopterin-guanine dinucleotide biosynthesis protein A